MDYRQAPRIASAEPRPDEVIDQMDSRPRFRRFDFGRSERQIDFSRVLLAGLLLLAAVLALSYLGTQTLKSWVQWLHGQPQYQLRFLDIQLRDNPPPWFRGGAEGFLKQVRDNAKETEVLPLMELEKGRIEQDFKWFPWVEGVTRVEFPPHAIIVHLVYRQPVARIPSPFGEEVFLDAKGFVLPAEDIEPQQLVPMIKVMGEGLINAPSIQPFRAWKSGAPGSKGARQEQWVQLAAKLAGFLQSAERHEEAAANPALRIKTIITDVKDERGFFLQNAEEEMILWGEAPGKDKTPNLEASEKWEIMKKWAKGASRRPLKPGDYWRFDKSELKAQETRRKGSVETETG